MLVYGVWSQTAAGAELAISAEVDGGSLWATAAGVGLRSIVKKKAEAPFR